MKVSLDRCEKQVEVWKLIGNSEELEEVEKCKDSPPSVHAQPFIRRVKVRPLYPKSKTNEYRELKAYIFKHISSRPDFIDFDRTLIEKTARLFCDWLLCEEVMSNESDLDNLRKYADALSKIDAMLIETVKELDISPALRRKLSAELMSDDEITKKLRAIMTAPLNTAQKPVPSLNSNTQTTLITQTTPIQTEQEKKVEP